jgi:hypothetical protein
MITYTWEFPRFSTHPILNGMTNVVHNVEFILTATDGEGHGAQVFGNIGLTEPDPVNFKNFNLLTQSVVEQWVEASMGEEVLNDYKQNLANQIEHQKAPEIRVLAKPW